MDDCNGFFSGSGGAFLQGALIGAGVALLFAPCSGRDARRRLQTFAERTGKRVRKAAEQGSRIAREAFEQGQEALEDTFSSKNRRHG